MYNNYYINYTYLRMYISWLFVSEQIIWKALVIEKIFV